MVKVEEIEKLGKIDDARKRRKGVKKSDMYKSYFEVIKKRGKVIMK